MVMSKFKTIDVLVSVYEDRLFNIANILENKDENVRFLICHQSKVTDWDISFIKNRDDVSYWRMGEYGVSKSRNFLIQKSRADIIYFADDDISLSSDFVSVLQSAHNSDPSAVITFAVNNEFSVHRKVFPNTLKPIKRTIFSILSVGTIEISAKREMLSKRTKFPEDMGAGAENPLGDEAVFLSTLLAFGITYNPAVICVHPDESSGGQQNSRTSYTRGLVIRRVFGYWSIPVGLLFLFRRFKLLTTDNGALPGIGYFVKGLLNRDFN